MIGDKECNLYVFMLYIVRSFLLTSATQRNDECQSVDTITYLVHSLSISDVSVCRIRQKPFCGVWMLLIARYFVARNASPYKVLVGSSSYVMNLHA